MASILVAGKAIFASGTGWTGRLPALAAYCPSERFSVCGCSLKGANVILHAIWSYMENLLLFGTPL